MTEQTTTWHVMPDKLTDEMEEVLLGHLSNGPNDLYQALVMASPAPPADGAVAICVERIRQISELGYLPETDDAYDKGQLLAAAFCYLQAANVVGPWTGGPPPAWPWAVRYWKPSNHRRNLIKAGALMAAEIDRQTRELQRRVRMHEKANRK